MSLASRYVEVIPSSFGRSFRWKCASGCRSCPQRRSPPLGRSRTLYQGGINGLDLGVLRFSRSVTRFQAQQSAGIDPKCCERALLRSGNYVQRSTVLGGEEYSEAVLKLCPGSAQRYEFRYCLKLSLWVHPNPSVA